MNNFVKKIMIMTFAATNPLLENWNTKHHTPPFTKIKVEHYVPATRQAIKAAEADINAIIKQKEKPTFENTIVAMETAGKKLTRVSELLFNLNECCTSDEMQKAVMTLLPEITRYSNWVSMNEKLFIRSMRPTATLSPCTFLLSMPIISRAYMPSILPTFRKRRT